MMGVALAAALAACEPRRSGAPEANAPAAVAAQESPNAAAAADAAVPAVATAGAKPAAPAFAVIYPGAAIEGPGVSADGAAGPGGMLTFTTEAAPDAVVAFYRNRAEAAGLEAVMAMNQGDARAYGAAGGGVKGPSLQVVAAPRDDGRTSVQLSWSAGG